MKKLIIALVAVGVVYGYAAEKKQLSEAERGAKRERVLMTTGGIVEKAAVGKVIIVDAQSKIPETVVREQVERLVKATRVKVDYFSDANLRGKPVDIASLAVPDGAGLVLFIVDDEKLPMSLVAVERGWGLMNVRELAVGKTFCSEFTRVTTLAFGAAASQVPTSALVPVRKISDFDKIANWNYTYDAYMAMVTNFKRLGIEPPRKSSYKRACEEGWAPAPTNKYQKAVWDKVHEMPKNPMKIEFDSKKGR